MNWLVILTAMIAPAAGAAQPAPAEAVRAIAAADLLGTWTIADATTNGNGVTTRLTESRVTYAADGSSHYRGVMTISGPAPFNSGVSFTIVVRLRWALSGSILQETIEEGLLETDSSDPQLVTIAREMGRSYSGISSASDVIDVGPRYLRTRDRATGREAMMVRTPTAG